MIYTLDDIRKLLVLATDEERQNLAQILDADLSQATGGVTGQAIALVDQLAWKYQTPFGYVTRRPTFDEMVVDVAKALKLKGLTEKECSCWDVLSELVRHLMKQILEKMTPEERKSFAEQVLTDEQFRDLCNNGNIDWGKLSAATLMIAIREFGGFATYRIALIVANQAARLLLGRGLTLAANAALVRVISIFLGPIGWILLAWGINDLFGTSYKRLIPGVLFIYCIYARVKEDGQSPF
jgi:uncharacterized protein YaaW (UPF0174 family)